VKRKKLKKAKKVNSNHKENTGNNLTHLSSYFSETLDGLKRVSSHERPKTYIKMRALIASSLKNIESEDKIIHQFKLNPDLAKEPIGQIRELILSALDSCYENLFSTQLNPIPEKNITLSIREKLKSGEIKGYKVVIKPGSEHSGEAIRIHKKYHDFFPVFRDNLKIGEVIVLVEKDNDFCAIKINSTKLDAFKMPEKEKRIRSKAPSTTKIQPKPKPKKISSLTSTEIKNKETFKKENVLHDMREFDLEIEKKDEIKSVFKNELLTTKIKLLNGEILTGRAYLNRARRYFFDGKNVAQSEVIDKLIDEFNFFPRIPLRPMQHYYSNPENLTHDLKAFDNKRDTHKNMTATSISTIWIVDNNGRKINGRDYIKEGGVAINLTETKKESHACQGKILNIFLKTANYTSRAKELEHVAYYLKPENILADLQSFANAIGLKSFMDINTSNISKVSIIRTDGEEIKGPAFIKQGGVAHKVATTTRKANPIILRCLEKLKEVAQSAMAA